MFNLSNIISIESNINFLKLRKTMIVISIFLLFISIILLSFKGLNLGIDFKGGTLIEVSTSNSNISELRKILSPSFNNISLYRITNFFLCYNSQI